MGCAIIGITLCHLDIGIEKHGIESVTLIRLSSMFHAFTSSVDIFMFLSGFGLYYSQRKNQYDFFTYFKRRILKILPWYFCIAGIIYGIRAVSTGETIGDYFKHLFFVSFFEAKSTCYWFVLAIMVFYLVFPLLYKLINKKQGKYISLAIIASYIVLTGLIRNTWGGYPDFKMPIERFPIFVFGVYIGKLSFEKAKMPKWILPVSVLLSILFLFATYFVDGFPKFLSNIHYGYYMGRGIIGLGFSSAVILVFEIAENKAAKNRSCFDFAHTWLSRIGAVTLQVYLFHQSFLIFANYPANPLLYFLIASVLPISVSLLVKQISVRKISVHQ